MDSNKRPPRCFVHEQMEGGKSYEGAMAEREAKEAALLAERGWYAHYVGDDPDVAGGVNAHTHGLAESYGHPDLQVALPIPPGLAHHLLSTVAARIKAGERFEAGCVDDGVIEGMPVRFHPAREGGRDVLRMILPDKKGDVSPCMDFPYRLQYEEAPR